ncbi:hypothetical protein EON81_19060 [bacterium]|nr:MAG: hypothetical protein EON81_19060 [bacterium]
MRPRRGISQWGRGVQSREWSERIPKRIERRITDSGNGKALRASRLASIMPVSLLLATVALGQGGALPIPVERWAAWLVAHTLISETKTWTRSTWRIYPSAQLDPGYLSPQRDRILRLDGWIGAFHPPRGSDGRVIVSLDPDPIVPGGAEEAAILLAQGRRDAAVALVRSLSPESVDLGIGRVVARHVWMRYWQATDAYHRGRDGEALATARSLFTDLPDLRAVLVVPASSRSSNDPFDFVNGLAGLLDELSRRLREPKPQIQPLSEASVADLVSGLREITGGIRFNGGRSNYRWLAIVRELSRRGNAAVPLLLQNLESHRLTRDVWHRDYSYTIEIASVFRPTVEALNQIAGTHGLPGVASTDSPAKNAR